MTDRPFGLSHDRSLPWRNASVKAPVSVARMGTVHQIAQLLDLRLSSGRLVRPQRKTFLNWRPTVGTRGYLIWFKGLPRKPWKNLAEKPSRDIREIWTDGRNDSYREKWADVGKLQWDKLSADVANLAYRSDKYSRTGKAEDFSHDLKPGAELYRGVAPDGLEVFVIKSPSLRLTTQGIEG